MVVGPAPGREDFGWYGFAADVLAVVDHLGLEHRPASAIPAGRRRCSWPRRPDRGRSRPSTATSRSCTRSTLPWPPSFETNPLAAGALRRREVFSSRGEALSNFSTKAPFDRLHPEVLAAYVDNGFGPPPGAEIRLRCRRSDEAQVYAHGLAHDAFAHLGRVRCPVILACGAETDAIGPTSSSSSPGGWPDGHDGGPPRPGPFRAPGGPRRAGPVGDESSMSQAR
jgi:hypothetical protein